MTPFQILDKHRRSGGNTDIEAAMREFAIVFAIWLERMQAEDYDFTDNPEEAMKLFENEK